MKKTEKLKNVSDWLLNFAVMASYEFSHLRPLFETEINVAPDEQYTKYKSAFKSRSILMK